MKSFRVNPAIVFCFLMCFAFAARAQDDCAWTMNKANATLNLRLGMTTAEVRAAFGKDLKVKLNPKGDYRFFQNYIHKTPPPKLGGVRALYLRFFERELYQIEIFYDEDFSPTLENFTGMLAAQFGFPASRWVYENKQAAIRCGENLLTADYVLNPRVELTNESVLTKVNELNGTKK